MVWVRKTGAIERDVAGATSRAMDPRALHFWDGKKAVMDGYRAPLGIDQDAWDVYLLYGPGAKWEGKAPPKPDFWMQNIGAPQAPQFEPGAFAAEAWALLGGGPPP